MKALWLAVLAWAIGGFGIAAAHDYQAGALTIEHPFARVAHANAKSGAVYFTIVNKGDVADRLLAAETAVAARAELHQSLEVDGVMRMRAMADGITIPADGAVALAPGGLHVMLMGLKQPLAVGDRFKATLMFAQAGAVEVDVHVEALPKADSDAHHHHH
ncbi:MAG: copper chaperone PCu(A)C [Sphingomonadales bacterium]